MKKIFGILAFMAIVFATVSPANAEPVFGFIYKNTTEAGQGISGVAPTKHGCATCTSFFGIVGLGECGISDAAKNGKIRTVSYYDYQTKNILGFKKVTVNVYGQ